MWRSGTTSTTTIGYINRNNQKVHGTRGIGGTDHVAYSYKLECLEPDCGHEYGANGTDIFQRKCPQCQGGNDGIKY
jgi:hypothetical protein